MLFGMEYEFQIQLDLEYQVSLGKIDPNLLTDGKYTTANVLFWPRLREFPPTNKILTFNAGILSKEASEKNYDLLFYPDFKARYFNNSEGGEDAGNFELRNPQPHTYVSDAVEEIQHDLLPRLVEMFSVGLSGICDFAIFTPKTYAYVVAGFIPSKHLNISEGSGDVTSLFNSFLPYETLMADIVYDQVGAKEIPRVHLQLPYRFEDYETLINSPEELDELATPKDIKYQSYNHVSLVGYSSYLCDEWEWHEEIV